MKKEKGRARKRRRRKGQELGYPGSIKEQKRNRKEELESHKSYDE